jgi:hypothetical protein
MGPQNRASKRNSSKQFLPKAVISRPRCNTCHRRLTLVPNEVVCYICTNRCRKCFQLNDLCNCVNQRLDSRDRRLQEKINKCHPKYHILMTKLQKCLHYQNKDYIIVENILTDIECQMIKTWTNTSISEVEDIEFTAGDTR